MYLIYDKKGENKNMKLEQTHIGTGIKYFLSFEDKTPDPGPMLFT